MPNFERHIFEKTIEKIKVNVRKKHFVSHEIQRGKKTKRSIIGFDVFTWVVYSVTIDYVSIIKDIIKDDIISNTNQNYMFRISNV